MKRYFSTLTNDERLAISVFIFIVLSCIGGIIVVLDAAKTLDAAKKAAIERSVYDSLESESVDCVDDKSR